jgi:uncharacterized protein
VVARVAGIYVRTRSGAPSVLSQVTIPGDQDMHAGNIVTQFPVRITGDIKKDFVVSSAVAVQVGGSVEDAQVDAGGDLVVRGGLLPGEHPVTAGGDAEVRHISGRRLRCRNLTVLGGITGSTIAASGRIEARDIHSSIVTAASGIVCDTLGDRTEQRVVVEAGIDPDLLRRFAGAEAAVPAAAAALAEATTAAHGLAQRTTSRFAARTDGGRHAAAEAIQAARQNLRDAEALVVDLGGQIAALAVQATTIQVVVRREVYPGVEVRLGRAKPFIVREHLRACTFIIRDGAVTTR